MKKILVANRGEIALRVMKACREMGISTVAVYSTCDKGSLPVRFADEAVCIGPPAPRESYLDIDKILSTAKDKGADAIHPGYGFLAENPELARRCAEMPRPGKSRGHAVTIFHLKVSVVDCPSQLA